MDYTNEQYALIERLEAGLHYDSLAANEQEIIRYLEHSGLVQPRAQIAVDYIELSQKGKRVLAAHRRKIALLEQNTKQKARERSERKTEKKKDRSFQIFLVLLGYALGLLTDNLGDLVRFLVKLFSDG